MSDKASVPGRRFHGRVALITGGGTGIGAAAARRLAAEGAHVVLTGRRAGPIESVAAELGGIAIAGDAADPSHAAAAVRSAVNRFGGVDVLIANAGAAVFGSVEDVSHEQWLAAFATNVEGALQFARAAIPEFRRRGGGAIVLVASMAALTAAPHGAPYITSKAAMLGLNRSIAFDYGPENIRCNVVCPGWVRTEMAEGGLSGLAQARGITMGEMIERTTRILPLRRMASPEELGAVIAFLASSDASFVTGSVVVADGGASVVDAGMMAVLA
jgi:meso-butanediol dehydrogenase / (S,S)-butanediol dehydrogenase / diacetyl reductase